MMIGVDFDNTIVNYDSVFYRAAVEQGLIPEAFVSKTSISETFISEASPPDKSSVKNYLCSHHNENTWTELQGYVYGKRMHDAELYPGVRDFFMSCRNAEVAVAIISHKTQYPYLGPRYDLRQAALEFIQQQFSEIMGDEFVSECVYFESDQKQKIDRINQLSCTHFIDDLPEFLSLPGFDASVQKTLFDPANQYSDLENINRVTNWSAFQNNLPKLSGV